MGAMVLPKLYSKINISKVTSKKLIEKYRHLIKWRKNESILEFGIGDGSNSENSIRPILPKDYKEYIASDLSVSMLNHVKETYSIPKSQFRNFDISEEPPEDFKNRFDHIFSLFTLHMVQNPSLVFKNNFTMLKEGGQMFHIFFEEMPSDPIFELLHKHPKWGKYRHNRMLSPYFKLPNRRQLYNDDIKKAGFSDYVFEVETDMTYIYENEQILTDLYMAINIILPDIPDSEKKEYTEYYLKKSKELCFSPVLCEDGKLRWENKYNMFVICATKK
ncbi:juvenile hormone acid O-methyltransferase-like [Diabrotica undecimpunctata]|uniref:juvenile hormone acid O-methyltransferase-like n=1 Tax=Diabrotica undecimpunctata TaxID=50387 RepID=UPI003B63B203